MSKEKRKFARAYIICKITVIFGERLLVFNSYTQNLSAGGMRVVLSEKLHVATPVEVELFIGGDINSLMTKGEVKWIREIGPVDREPHFIDTGIEFTQMRQSDREALAKLADNIILQEDDYRA